MGTKIQGGKQVDAFNFEVSAVRSMAVDPPERFMDAAYLEWIVELADKIYANGQEQEVIFRRDSAGGVHLMAGRSRRLAVLYINDHPDRYEIPAKHYEKWGGWPLRGSLREATEGPKALDLAVGENEDRRPYGPIDYMQACIYCTQVLQLDQRETAQHLRLFSRKTGEPQQSTVSVLLSLAGLPHATLSLVNSGRLTVGAARKLVGRPIVEVTEFTSAVTAGGKVPELLRGVEERKRAASGKPILRKTPEVIAQLEEIGTPLAIDLAAFLRGDPTVGSLDLILVGASLRAKGVPVGAIGDRERRESAA